MTEWEQRQTRTERLTRGLLYVKTPTWWDAWSFGIAGAALGYLLGAR